MPNIDKIRVDNVDYDINMDVYTTTETRIGTWIDGKPLYRKVYTKTYDGSLGQDITDLNIEELIKLDGFINNGIPINFYMDNSHFCFTHCDDLQYIWCSMTGWTPTKVKFIVEYTKTTDIVN